MMDAKQAIRDLVEVYSTFYDGEESLDMYDWVEKRARTLLDEGNCDVDIRKDYIYVYCDDEELYPNEVELIIEFVDMG